MRRDRTPRPVWRRRHRATTPVRVARPDELAAVLALVGERAMPAGDLAAAIAVGHVLVLDEGEHVIAAMVVGPAMAARVRLLVVHPSIIAAGIIERMNQAAAALCAQS